MKNMRIQRKKKIRSILINLNNLLRKIISEQVVVTGNAPHKKKKKFRKINEKDLKFVNYINEQIESRKSENGSEYSELNSESIENEEENN